MHTTLKESVMYGIEDVARAHVRQRLAEAADSRRLGAARRIRRAERLARRAERLARRAERAAMRADIAVLRSGE
jgi:hypothetical protein